MKATNATNYEGLKASPSEILGASIQLAAMRVARLLVAMLREIFDEAAYARFLGCDGQVSRESYAAFVQQREAKVARKPRCC
jgi:hypothetical protein